MGEILDCFCKDTEFAQSLGPEEAIFGSYDKCEPGLSDGSGYGIMHLIARLSVKNFEILKVFIIFYIIDVG